MNWYKIAKLRKKSSVTFTIEGTNKIAEPMNKNDICSDLADFIIKNTNINKQLFIPYLDIDPDMSSGAMDSFTGNVNFYLRDPNITDTEVINIIDQYNQFKMNEIQLSFLGINNSGQNVDDEGNPLRVARIEIVKNDTEQLNKIPEMNLSNSNAYALINLLINEGILIENYDSEEGLFGNIDASNLLEIIGKVKNESFVINPYTKEPSTENNFHEGGRSIEQMMRYIEKLEEMANYIKENNLPNQTISFG